MRNGQKRSRPLALAAVVFAVGALLILAALVAKGLDPATAGGLGPRRSRLAIAGALVCIAALISPVRSRLSRTQRGTGVVPKAFSCFWFVFWIVFLAWFVELLAALFFPLPPDIGKRPFHPYLMTGGYYASQPYETMMRAEGPQAYGYERTGGYYVYGFGAPVSGIYERGGFLFQDKRAEAEANEEPAGLRVFVIGGSAAWGRGASDRQHRWYWLLERSLRSALGTDVQIIPAAMGAFVSTQERLVLELMVLERKPDAVIVLDGYNDATLPGLGSRPGDPYNQTVLYGSYYSPMFGPRKFAARHSIFFRFITHRSLVRTLEKSRERILADPVRVANYGSSVASVYIDNLSRMEERCRSQGIPFEVFLQPARALTWRTLGIPRELSSLDKLTLIGYDAMIRRLQTQDALKVHDLTGILDDPALAAAYLDAVHFSDRGHRLVAEAMHPVVADRLSERRRITAFASPAAP